MTSAKIPADLYRLVIDRAQGRCEYCLLHQSFSIYTHEVDHIIAQKHRRFKNEVQHPDQDCLSAMWASLIQFPSILLSQKDLPPSKLDLRIPLYKPVLSRCCTSNLNWPMMVIQK
jgi:hypothetical protein